MSKQITLTLNDASGNPIGQYNINTAGSALHIEAVDGAYYQFTDQTTGIGPEGLITEREGDNLLVSFDDGVDLVIENYYGQSQPGALVGLQADGGLTSYPVATAPEHVLAEQIAAEQTLGSDQPVWAPLGVLGAVGLVAAGIGLAKNNDGEKIHSNNNGGNNNNNNNPAPSPSPNTPNNPGSPNVPSPNPNNPGNQNPGNPNNPTPNPSPNPPTPSPTPSPNPQPPTPNQPGSDPKPRAENDKVKGTPKEKVTIDVLDNDSGIDANGQRDLDPNSIRLIDAVGNAVTRITVAGQGEWNVQFGKVTFTPEPNFTGNPTPVQYTVSDKAGQVSNKATITVTYNDGANTPGLAQITGDAKVGQTLTADINDPDGVPASSVKYQWLADGGVIAGATGKTYTVQPGDLGKTISVKVVYTDGAGHYEDITSQPTAKVADGTPAPQPPQLGQNHPGSVAISGNAKVGEKLTAEVHDDDQFDASKVKYQWQRDGQPIAGESGSSYTLKAEDVGHKITVKVEYTDNAGNKESHDATSATVQGQSSTNHAPTDIQLANNSVIEGKDGATIGKLTTTDPDAGDTHTYTVSDSRFEVTADGTLKLKAGQHLDYASEKTVNLQITTNDGHGGSYAKTITVNVQDDPNYPAPNPNPNPNPNPQPGNHEGTIAISGVAKVGETLTAQVADQDGVDQSKVKYQWLADGKEIAGATESTFTLTEAQKGAKITVKATYTDNANHAEDITSSATDAVRDDTTPPPATNHEGTVAISGVAKVGETLTAQVADQDGVDPSKVKYQWLADGKEIAGATNSTFTLTEAQKGAKITVKATYTDNANHAEDITSSATDAVRDDTTPPPNPNPNPNPNPQPGNHEGKVAITGEAKVGSELKATVTDDDGVPTTGVKYQWFADGKAINGATESTFTLTEAQKGAKITVKATYTDNANHAEDLTSSATDAVRDDTTPPPATNHEGTVAISGVAKVGETLTAQVADQDGVDPSKVKYQWLADGKAISGATESTFTLTEAQKGAKITVKATYTDNANHAEDLTSSATDAVRDDTTPPPATNHEGTVAISGVAKVGETLTAQVADQDGVDPSKVKYQWLADGKEISGATNSTFTLTEAQKGAKITVKATYTDNANHAEDITSSATDAVRDDTTPPPNPNPNPNPNPQPGNHEGKVAITGEAKVGSELKATVTDDDGVDSANVSYQWLANGTAIAGATGASYTLTAAEVGKTITVRAVYTDNGGHSESITSTATAAVTDPANPNPQPPQPPQNHEGSVTVSGEAKVGSELQATVADEDGFDSANVSYQWLANGSAIAGATGASYTLTAAEVGKTITVRAVYTDNGGHSESVQSTATAAVTDPANPNPQPPQPPQNHEGTVTVAGEAKVGSELQATVADEDGVDSANVTYQWLADGTAIAGATGASYTLTANEVGKTITVRAVYTDNGGHSESVQSTATAAVTDPANPNPQPPQPPQNHEGTVTVTGEAKVGSELQATVADEDGVDSANVTYQWLADGTAIAGATGASYTLTAAEVGKTITVRAVYTDNGGHSESVQSTATAAVTDPTNPNPQPPQPPQNHEGTVAISGEAKVGSELQATVADEDGVDSANVTYQWLADGTAIAGATGASYTLTAAEVGKTITVRAVYTDNGGHSESVQSTATAAVTDPANPNPQPPQPPQNHEGSVTVTGEAKVGSELQATVADEDGFDSANVSYQWLADGTAIAGATGASYTLTANEVGKTITVRAVYTDNGGHSESVQSTATAAVTDPANPNPQPPQPPQNHEGTVTVTGEAKVGSELQATVADEDGVDSANVSYQWLANGIAIAGATGANYTLTANEVGKTITVRAVYTDNGGHSESVQSTATAAVTDPANPNPQPPQPPQNHEGTVTVTGEAKVGSELQATVADEDGVDPAKVQYQWLRDGAEISGANGNSYTLQAEDAGHKISVKARYTDNGNHAENLTSAETGSVSDGNNPPPNPQPPQPPQNHEGSVTVSGEAKVGSELQATVADEDGVDSANVSYQWLANGTAIAGATGASYTLTAAEVGKTITVRAVYTDNGGHSESVQSTATAAVTDPANPNPQPPQPPQNHEGTVTVTGEAKVGSELQATVADEDGVDSANVTYQWLANGSAIAGATGASYTLTANEVGKTITVRAVYTDNGGHSESVTSTATAAVTDPANPNPQPPQPPQNHEGSVTVTGEAKVGSELQATVADEDGFDSASVTYQWLANGSVIAGATGASYTLTAAEVGKTITVRAVYTDNGGHSESVQSTATATVTDPANPNPQPPQPPQNHEGTVTVTGEAKVGSELQATVADEDGVDSANVSYQWLADGTAIAGATGASYTLTAAEVGKTITVRAVYTDNGGHSESVQSTATAAVTDPANPNPQPPQPPQNHEGTVAISGEAKVGSELQATVADEDGVDSANVSYQWLANGTAIAGATGASYTLTAAEVGKTITVRAVYTDNGGHSESITSTATAAVTDPANPNPQPPQPPQNHEGSVTVSGEAKVGSELQATVADEDGVDSANVTYQWLADGTAIAGATGASYTLTANEVGKTITVRAVYTDNGGHSESVQSTATAAVTDPANPNPQPPQPPQNHEGTITVTGEAKVGSELQATVTDEDGVDPAKVQYQWLRDGAEISGANGASYTLQAEDAGHKISVKASYTDNANHAENLTSAETGNVSDGNTPPQNHEGTVTVSGEAKVGSELQATVADEDGFDPAKVQYQWLRDGEVIADAGGSSYRLVADDVGHKISVKASYTDNGNHAEVLTSTGTDAVANLPAPTLERDPQHQGGIIARPADGADYMEVQYRAEYGAKESTIVRKDPTTGEWSASGAYRSLDAKTGEVVIPPNAVEDGTTVRAYNSIGENGKGGHSDTVEVTADNDLSTVGLPEITQDSAHQGGMIIKPGANSDTLEISYTDEKEQAHQLTVYKDQFDNDQWKGKDLPEGVQVDATSGTVTLAPQVVKDRSEVQARSGDSAGNDFSDYVKGVSDVNGVMPNQPGSVAISGEAKVGSDLTATVTDADGVPETVQYQWLRDGTPIGGATGNSYTLQAEDVGHKISVRATYRDNAQHDETPTSSETDSVADNVQPNQPGQVAISGSHKVNEPLTATVNDADGVPDNGVQYQWFNAGTGKDIAGATGNSYTPGVADAGQKFGVRVSYQDNKGHEENLTVSDDAVVQSAGKPTVGLIGPNAVNEGGQGNYTLKLDKPTHEDVTVTLEATSYFNGPAPKDIVYNKTVRIPAGETEVTVPLSVKDDHEIKSGSFGLGITGASGADISTDAKQVTTRVIDNDAADGLPSVNISTDRPMLTAGETATYKVTLSKPANHAVTMDIRVDGSLKVGTGDDSDLKLSTQKITIPAGETEATFTASAKPDSVAAGQTMTFHLAPDNLQGAEMGKDPRWGGPQNNEVNGSINGANSTPQVMLVGDDAVVREGDQVTLKVQLSHATDHDVSVTVRSGSYDGSSFVEGGTQTVTIPKGQTSTSFTLTTKDDQVARAVNHADVFIENANGAEIARYRGHSVSINALDNDAHPAPTATKDGNGMINLTPGFDISQENNQLAYMQVRFTDRSGQTYELRAKLDNHAFSNQWGFADGYGINSFSGITIDKQSGTVTIPQSLLQPGSEVSAQNHNDPYGSAASATTTTQADATLTENVPTPLEETKPAEAATAPGGALHHETPDIAHGSEDDTAAHHAGGDSHHGLHVSDGIDTAAYSGLVNLDGEDLLHYLGEHSAELLAATQQHGTHALHGGAGDDVLVAGHGTELLSGGAGADTFAYLLDSHDASGWNEPGKILDFNPQEGDRIVLAGGSGTKASVSSDEHGQHLHVSDDAGHTRTIDIASQGGKTLSAEDILSHVDIAPKGYSEPSYTAPQTHHLPQDDHSHLI